MQPQVAVAPSGRIYVTFGQGSAVYCTASADGGRTFTKAVKVGEFSRLALGLRRGPRIVAADRVVTISAISAADGNLQAWISRDGGTTWQTAARINDQPQAAREGLHAMASDGQGNVLAVWLDDRHGGKELWRAISADGGATWGANALVYQSPDGHICECCHPSAALDTQGHAVVMWRNWLGGARDLYAALSSDRGQSFAPARKLGSGTWPLNGCPMDGGAIALEAGGEPRAAWRREGTVYASALDGREEPLAAPATQPVIVTGPGGAYEFWESGGGLTMRRGTASPARLAGDARFASAATLPEKGAIVVWESRAHGQATLLAEVVE